MPGAHSRFKPASAAEVSASDEESQLKVYLQRQLEDDVARIFDESIYSDLEVVCGKLKILTHSCILKTRTHNFYHKLKNILHVNIGRNAFDEIYSFISDAYTECDIEHQEKEILAYLKKNFNTVHSDENTTWCSKKDTEDTDVFYTPKCAISPNAEKGFKKIISSSPSTELTKEYYALVPINGSLVDKELIEQDALSNAFLSIIKTQIEDKIESTLLQRNKPTSLSLSSHSSKTVKHSNTCDILTTCCVEDNTPKLEKNNDVNAIASQDSKFSRAVSSNPEHIFKNSNTSESNPTKFVDPAYSPDSLITDEPSSSSDYLSPAYTFSPGAGSSCLPQLNVGDNITKMENIFTISDSGLENTEMMENLNSHKDVTLTDISLTESTFYDLATDETNNSNESTHSSLADKKEFQKIKQVHSPQLASLSSTSTEMDCNGQNTSMPVSFKEMMSGKSLKEEKQRQNEEIVTLESSSLSSETGSWESVFPPKLIEKEACEKKIKSKNPNSSNCNLISEISKSVESSDYVSDKPCPSLVQKSIKSTSCFIDAASLVEEEDAIPIQKNEILDDLKIDTLPAPSQPVPCSTVKVDISPNDWSESIDNEDSLEQGDNKDPDSIQKDLSPTIFEMTPVTEDSLCANTFENTARTEEETSKIIYTDKGVCPTDTEGSLAVGTVYMISTPNNSIMSLKASTLKQYDSEESEYDTTYKDSESNEKLKTSKFCTSSTIISGGASIEDHLPQLGSHSGSPLPKRQIDNIPIVSGAYIPDIDDNQGISKVKLTKAPSAPTWVVDMSRGHKSESASESNLNMNSNKPGDKVSENLKTTSRCSSNIENFNKSRSSVDSDSSERSSHKFYIDLSSLPDPLPPEKSIESESVNEKKNMFTMYIDLGEKSSLKEMPARLSNLNSKKYSSVETTKCVTKNNKVTKIPMSEPNVANKNASSLYSFEKIESLCNDPSISISEIIKIPEKPTNIDSDVNPINDTEVNKKEKYSRSLGDKAVLRSTSTVIQEEPATAEPVNELADLFVKLSDLDKPLAKISDLDKIAPKPLPSININEEKVWDVRMTRSIPGNNWGEKSLACNSRSIDIISSFHSENALSLNRLFPHLKNEFSRSVPGSLSSRTRSPLRLGNSTSTAEVEEPGSDMSEMSSVQSSICRSVIENSTTEETSQTSSLVGSCQSRLGQDLLRMFLEEIAPDVIVEVSGKRIKAHKCILSSRCQFFAGILSGGWVESAGNVIALPSFSYNVVHFAMCHIYSGLSAIPDTISILELATLADMLGLEGLKEAIMFTLKAKYCHHFHRPCSVCVAGVLECFPLSSAYGLDDLYRKCLRWITKYFTRVWPTKAFATLPSELLEKCYQQHVVHLTTDNLVETVYGCGMTVASLQNSRWAETVARMCRRVVNAAAHFAATRLVAVLGAVALMPPEAPPPAKQAFNDCLAAAIEWAPPDEACRAYAFLSDLAREIKTQHYAKPDLITNSNQGSKASAPNNLLYAHAASWRLQCEGALVRATPRVVGTQAFQDLPSELRKRLRELGCIMYGAQAIPVTSPSLQDKKTRSAYYNKAAKARNASASRSLDIDHVRASFVPYAPKPTAHVSSVDILKSNNDLRDPKKTRTKPPKVRTTKAQEERAKFNMFKNNQSQERPTAKTTAARPHSYKVDTKPRYLEPIMCKEAEKRMPAANKLVPRMVSSSESSRNSSPIHARNLRSSRMKSRQACEVKAQDMSQDSLATSSRPRTAEPSTDSLSESQNSNKYATYTKTKHNITKGSIESIKSLRCHNVAQTTGLQGKMKTKIPVYLNQNVKSDSAGSKSSSASQKRPVQSAAASLMTRSRGKASEQKTTGSLMNATKSSSAKMVPRIVKDPPNKKTSVKSKPPSNNTTKQEEHDEMPAMERSGTFLKDEPTFGDKTTTMDIGQ